MPCFLVSSCLALLRVFHALFCNFYTFLVSCIFSSSFPVLLSFQVAYFRSYFFFVSWPISVSVATILPRHHDLALLLAPLLALLVLVREFPVVPFLSPVSRLLCLRQSDEKLRILLRSEEHTSELQSH